jgi:hypothetical protein
MVSTVLHFATCFNILVVDGAWVLTCDIVFVVRTSDNRWQSLCNRPTRVPALPTGAQCQDELIDCQLQNNSGENTHLLDGSDSKNVGSPFLDFKMYYLLII